MINCFSKRGRIGSGYSNQCGPCRCRGHVHDASARLLQQQLSCSRRDRGKHGRFLSKPNVERRVSDSQSCRRACIVSPTSFMHACILAVDAVSSLRSGEYGTADIAATPTSKGDCGT